MKPEQLVEQTDRDLETTAVWLFSAFAFGCLALVGRFVALAIGGRTLVGVPSAWIGQLFTALIWSCAWLAAGFLFGFIFGVPKVITTAPTVPRSGGTPKLKVNTNLEEISDWLTKILVGATLTQILRIPHAISTAAWFMSVGDTGPTARATNAGILVYNGALGFLSGYILTRMFFARAFALADRDPFDILSAADADSLRAAPPVTLGTTSTATDIDPQLKRAAAETTRIPITVALSGEEAGLIAKGATIAGDAQRAIQASELAIQKTPEDLSARLAYAWSLQKLGAGPDEVLPVVEAAARRVTSRTNPQTSESIYLSLSYLYLYQPPPGGYEKALRAIADYDKVGTPNAGIEVNRACAYGQKYQYLSERASADQDASTQTELTKAMGEARNCAFKAVRKALELEPSSSTRLKELLWVTGDPNDNDLAVFQDDPDFTILLPRPAQA